MQIQIPIQVKELLNKPLFNLDGVIDDVLLNKYLFYMPETIQIIGLGIAELKREKREKELTKWAIEKKMEEVEAKILLEIMDDIDAQKYRNEQMRNARVRIDDRYKEVLLKQKEVMGAINTIDSDIDELMEEVYRYRNLNQNLNSISQLRISERRY